MAAEAVGAIARKALDRKTGARGLRSIMEDILLDSIFDLPSLEGVKEVVISQQVVDGTARPLYMCGGGMTIVAFPPSALTLERAGLITRRKPSRG